MAFYHNYFNLDKIFVLSLFKMQNGKTVIKILVTEKWKPCVI